MPRRLASLAVPLAALLLAAAPRVPAAAQEVRSGARAAALLAATPLGGDAWGTASPAAWSTLGGPTVAMAGGQAFGLAALRHGGLALAWPHRLGTAAVAAHTFGFAAYRETRVRAGAARGFRLGTTRRVHAGAAVTYVHTAIDGYGASGAAGVSAGLRVTVRPGLHAAVHARNLTGAQGGESALPRALAAGVLLERPGLAVAVDVYDDLRFPLAVRAGVEATPVPALALRVGVASAPTRTALGVGVRAGRVAADVAATRHAVLGWSPAVSLTVAW